jgi:hypothetical protein
MDFPQSYKLQPGQYGSCPSAFKDHLAEPCCLPSCPSEQSPSPRHRCTSQFYPGSKPDAHSSLVLSFFHHVLTTSAVSDSFIMEFLPFTYRIQSLKPVQRAPETSQSVPVQFAKVDENRTKTPLPSRFGSGTSEQEAVLLFVRDLLEHLAGWPQSGRPTDSLLTAALGALSVATRVCTEANQAAIFHKSAPSFFQALEGSEVGTKFSGLAWFYLATSKRSEPAVVHHNRG